VYAALMDGTVWAIEAETGEARGLANLGAAVLASPAFSDGDVYVGTQPGDVVAVDAGTGDVRWTARAGEAMRFGPAVDAQRVYAHVFNGGSMRLVALDRATGEPVWERAFDGGTATPVLHAGRLVVAADGIAALDPATGDTLWETELFVTIGGIAAAGDTVYALGASAAGETLLALDAATGAERWAYTHDADFSFSPPAIDLENGIVLAGSEGGVLYAHAADTGERLWQLPVDDAIASRISVERGTAFFLTTSGMLYAVDTRAGRVLLTQRPGGVIDGYAGALLAPGWLFRNHGATLFGLRLEWK
jgi:outer membrane protein assembly factor BamB